MVNGGRSAHYTLLLLVALRRVRLIWSISRYFDLNFLPDVKSNSRENLSINQKPPVKMAQENKRPQLYYKVLPLLCSIFLYRDTVHIHKRTIVCWWFTIFGETRRKTSFRLAEFNYVIINLSNFRIKELL